MPVKFNMICRTFFLILTLFVISHKVNAQQSHFYEARKLETLTNQKQKINFGREISSIVIDISREEAFFGTAIYVNGEEHKVFHDADAPYLQGKFRSNIVIFKQPATSI